ncbi:hypothetical protein FQN50_009152 [Emmonsiellopsis sp. PD_5]|nr:hypothetical protein FQN50_009152 [Emmonsiellopsis sp. PD_5]
MPAAANAPDNRLMTSHADAPRLKAHKALPRKRDVLPTQDSISLAPSPSPGPDDTLSSNRSAYPTAPALPLTPPAAPLEPPKKSKHAISREVSDEFAPGTTGSATPTHQLSPPTPDITPPRVISQFRKREGLAQQQPSMSSRAESFTTAREALSSEDEPEKLNASGTPSLRPARHKLPHPLRTNTSSSDPEPPPSSSPPRDVAAASRTPVTQTDASTFDTFDGQWSNPQGESVARFQKKKHRRRPILDEHDLFSQNHSPSDSQDTAKSSLNREKSLKEKVRASHKAPRTSSVEKFGEDIGWISGEDQLDMGERIHAWRLSGISTTSTVEAMVIDSPPRKKPALRHTEKNSSLRSASSPIPKSYSDDLASSNADQHRRLLRQSVRITNENRRSVSSDMSLPTSVVSTRPKPKQDVIPVVVIPQRRSSLKSSNPGSRNHSQTRSLSLSRRPTTAPDSGIGSFDIPRRKRRTLSESLPSTSSRDANRRSYNSGPIIPQRRSSLSAPTSRNHSRAASLTSESLRHNQQLSAVPSLQPRGRSQEPAETTVRKQPTLVIAPAPAQEPVTQYATTKPNTLEQSNDENGPLISPSLRLTPFQPSIQSLSPGPVEIHEARAVPFFFHNNRSLLVVEQYPLAESKAVQELRTYPPDMEIAQPQTPVMLAQAELADVDSPLRNPRAPPKPPAVKAIPATTSTEPERPPTLDRSNSDGNGNRVRRLSSVRRAFSSRRQSETYATPYPIHHVRNPKAVRPMDNELHRFWLPRPFWEGVVDSDAEGEGNPRFGSPIGTRGDGVYVGNSLGIPQKRIILAGPLSVIRRLSHRSRHRNAGRNYGNQALPTQWKTGLQTNRVVRSARRGRQYAQSRLGSVHAPIRSLRQLQEWVARIRRQRAEEKLEARRDKLRKSIGGRVLVNNTATMVPDGR